MTRLHALVRAPSNIALIKYMGKRDASANLPENGSLSMTLDALCTWVEIERTPGEGDARLLPEVPSGIDEGSPYVPELSEAGRGKVLRHVERVRQEAPGVFARFGLQALDGDFGLRLRSANTFPAASGIASSASSFAALTLAVALACSRDSRAFAAAWETEPDLRRACAVISRQGSGSSCRSFEGPFVLWEGEGARPATARVPELSHFVILVSEEAKSVSSSEAHARVKTSPLWQGRIQRVEERLARLEAALQTGDLAQVARLAWVESWEMHSLFHTSRAPFTYWKPGSVEALQWFAGFFDDPSVAPPVVTMDAGPNLHVIVPSTEAPAWRERLRGRFGAHAILEDRPGRGARIVRLEEGISG